MTAKLVAVHCKFYPGIFPSERYFEVTLANGEKHKGIAPRHFCWNAQGCIIQEDESTNGVAGLVAAKLLYQLQPEQENLFAVEVPDGEALAIEKDLMTHRPTKISPPEPFGVDELELPNVFNRS